MKIKSALMLSVCVIISFMTMGLKDLTSSHKTRKRILILTCEGGYGHMAMTKTLHEMFDAEYDVMHIEGIKTAANSIPPHRMLYGKKHSGVDTYNTALKTGRLRLTNFMIKAFACRALNFYGRNIYKGFKAVYNELKPDLVISVIQFINHPAQRAAREANIPFLLLNLDCDLSLFLNKVEKCNFSDDKFLMTVVEKTNLIRKQLADKKIPESCVFEAGFQVRSDFFEPKDTSKIRRSWHIPANKKTILVMMGGQGSVAITKYAAELAQIDKDVHVLFCLGKSTELTEEIEKIMAECTRTTYQCIPFTNKISDLMAVSDIMISAPKPNSCYEALYTHLPVIIDRTSACLFWEKATIDVLHKRKQAYVIRRTSQLEDAIDALWDRKKQLISNAKKSYDPNVDPKRFPATITMLIKRLLNEPHSADLVVEPTYGNIVKPA